MSDMNTDAYVRHRNIQPVDPSLPSPSLSPTLTSSQSSTSTSLSSSHHKSSSPVYKHVYVVHSSSITSCLSPEAPNNPGYSGIWNLIILMLVVSNIRLIIENYCKYGLLVSFRLPSIPRQDVTTSLALYASVPCHLFIAYLIEFIAAKSTVSFKKYYMQTAKSSNLPPDPSLQFKTWIFVALAHSINATFNLAFSSYIVYFYIFHPALGGACILHSIIVWIKSCSYALTNRDLRHAYITSAHPDTIPDLYKSCPYPCNISLDNLIYFWWAPTLVYQPVYPRTPRIRWSFICKRLMEVVILTFVIWFTCIQYAFPIMISSIDKLSKDDHSTLEIVERVLKLSNISLCCWLAGFFAFFQSFLNALAELLRFADRKFYIDWWNATTIRQYWSSWNRPVYFFLKRHVYLPLLARDVSPKLAQVFVFTLSGLLHELLVGIPSHNILGIAFLGMIFQIPLTYLTDLLVAKPSRPKNIIGNVTFWVSFCLIGQPLAGLMYFFAWHTKYPPPN